MTAIEWRYVVLIATSLITALLCFSYAATRQRRRAKKPVYLVAGLLFLYAALVYLYGLTIGAGSYIMRSGWLTSVNFFLLAFAYIMLIITDWRRL